VTTLDNPPAARGSAASAGTATPLDRLRELHWAGTLAAGYPAAAALVAEIGAGDDAIVELPRAGTLLRGVKPDEVLAAHPDTDVVRVAIAGHSTVGAVVAPLVAEFARHGMLLRHTVGEFDSYLRDLQDTGSPLYAPGTDLALVLLDPQVVFDELSPGWQVADLAQAVADKLAQLTALTRRYVEHGTGMLVLNTAPLLRTYTHQLVDHRSRAALGVAWREFNTGLLRLALDHPRVIVIDLDPLVAAGGPVSEARMASYAKVNLGDEILARYAREVAHLGRAIRGRTKKVLVVDLDNTLWDGILGDDGPEGIAAATTFRGEAFGNFQRVVKQIGSQGVLLAVSSKNDQEPVLAVLREHPDMVLRESDFARVNANWNPKDGNLRDIAERLNLGVDSFVFVDDSPFECGLVAASLPAVAVVRLDEEPALHAERLLADGWFDVIELTAEDRARAGMYRADAARQSLMAGADSMEEYLNQLGVVVEVKKVGEGEVARVAQLTLRTNQFNLTTLRLSPEEVAARAADPGQIAVSIRSADRFGANGVVGAVFARVADDGLHVDNMLLSCRVFARGIETAAMASLLAHAAGRGLPAVYATYRPTAKNGKVAGFYPSLGFTQVADDDGTLSFRHDLADLPTVPTHLRLESELEGPTT
jgi:FkbH-like protein